jgi:hypothetical protein
MNEEGRADTDAPEEEDALSRILPAGPPFGPAFFATVLGDRVRAACDGQPEHVPVVELHLADGLTLDLCHILGVEPQWLAVQAYRDRETCEEMDLVFAPYGLITRVTVSMWQPSQRPIGFQLTRPDATGAGTA